MQYALKESVWTVIGAGPCGVASVGRLLDLNVKKVILLKKLQFADDSPLFSEMCHYRFTGSTHYLVVEGVL